MLHNNYCFLGTKLTVIETQEIAIYDLGFGKPVLLL